MLALSVHSLKTLVYNGSLYGPLDEVITEFDCTYWLFTSFRNSGLLLQVKTQVYKYKYLLRITEIGRVSWRNR